MMKFLEFDKTKCDECFKCLRVCPTKAIAFTADYRKIVDEKCIKCGLCQASCPTEALRIQNDRFAIRKSILLGKQLAVSLAPSFVGAFKPETCEKIVSVLKALGFKYIEETGVGAEYVSRAYESYIHTAAPENLITSCCPSANYYLELTYPELTKFVAPVQSPMAVHARLLKEKLGSDWKVVFIGPCLAKKAEAEEVNNQVDYVLTFRELQEWIDESHIQIDALEHENFPIPASIRGSAYPIGGSLLNMSQEKPLVEGYRHIRADGALRLKDVFESLKENRLKGYCIEVNMCDGSCVNGPDMPRDHATYYERKDRVLKYVEVKKNAPESCSNYPEVSSSIRETMSKDFSGRGEGQSRPTEDEIKKVLAAMGKYHPQDSLNCGACGYLTCEDKAIAVLEGMADPHFCVPYLRNKAEGLQNAIFDHSPNMIVILDEKGMIRDANPMFHALFNTQGRDLRHLPFSIFVSDDSLWDLFHKKQNWTGQKLYVDHVDKTVLVSVVHIAQHHAAIAIMTDLSAYEKQRDEMNRVKEQTLAACQRVIENQMRVAQEVASLLGETTAETKVGLNRLKEIVLGEGKER